MEGEFEQPIEYLYFGAGSRTLLLNNEISMRSASKLCDDLLAANSESDEPIKLIINSPGGDAYGTIMIMDTIQSIETPVLGIVSGLAASGAFYTLQACDLRAMTEHSFLFWHQMISYNQEIASKTEMFKLAKQYEAMNKRFEDFLRARARISVPNWKKFFIEDNDIYFNSEESLSLNLVDEVIEPVKTFKKPKKDVQKKST